MTAVARTMMRPTPSLSLSLALSRALVVLAAASRGLQPTASASHLRDRLAGAAAAAGNNRSSVAVSALLASTALPLLAFRLPPPPPPRPSRMPHSGASSTLISTPRGAMMHRRLTTATTTAARTALGASPKKMGSAVENYRTVSVNCRGCRTRLFRYKKKNGTKSNLVKCYVERIWEDSAGLLAARGAGRDDDDAVEEGEEWHCPKCGARFARSAVIRGRPALKMVGGKVRMTKK